MSSNVDRIASLEASISRYEAAWDASTDEATKVKLIDLITESRRTLNILLTQQSKHIFYSYHLLAFLVWSCIYILVDDLYKLLSNRVFSTNVFLLNNLQFTADILLMNMPLICVPFLTNCIPICALVVAPAGKDCSLFVA